MVQYNCERSDKVRIDVYEQCITDLKMLMFGMNCPETLD